MTAQLRSSLVILLCLAACNHQDSELFGGDAPASGSGGSAATVAGAGGSDVGKPDEFHPLPPAGGTNASSTGGSAGSGSGGGGGGTGDTTSTAGTAPAGGGSVDPGGGSSSDLQQPGASGADPGASGGAGSEVVERPTPVCGNGKLEEGEQCDDASHASKDGCSDACKVVCADYGPGTVESTDHHCYNGYDTAAYDGAIEQCQQRGAHLATIASEAENAIARGFVHDGKWIGAFENAEPTNKGAAQYEWITGEPFSYSNWSAKEPNAMEYKCPNANQPCFEHCVSLLGDGTWADRRCDVSDGYVCEWEPAGSE